jgi:hypothetical protein
MFFPEGQIRVRLYGAPCDMRKYGPSPDMRNGSPVCAHSFWNFSAFRALHSADHSA